MSSGMERDIAIMEGEMNHSEDEYFKARPQINTGHCRHLFRAGFERAWQAALAQGDAESTPEQMFDHYMRTAIANAPEPVQKLGEYLTSTLNEDNWPEAERLLNQICAQAVPEGKGSLTEIYRRESIRIGHELNNLRSEYHNCVAELDTEIEDLREELRRVRRQATAPQPPQEDSDD